MKYVIPFIVKFAIFTAILWFVLGAMYEVSFANVLFTSIVLTGLASLGDVLILPRIGYVLAAVGDFIFVFIGIMIIGSYLYAHAPLEAAAFIAATLIAIEEVFFHAYLRDHLFTPQTTEKEDYSARHMQTEFSEELDPEEEKAYRKKSDDED